MSDTWLRVDRLERDVLSLSGLSAIVWLEGINDIAQGTSADDVIGQSRDTVRHVNELYGVHREVGLIPLGIERPPARVAASKLGRSPGAVRYKAMMEGVSFRSINRKK